MIISQLEIIRRTTMTNDDDYFQDFVLSNFLINLQTLDTNYFKYNEFEGGR